jgi:hypothetical protein
MPGLMEPPVRSVRRRLARMAVIVALGVVLVVAVPAGFHQAMTSRYGRSPAPAAFAMPRSRGEANRQDLEYLRATFPVYDRSLTPATRLAFDSVMATMLRAADTLSRGALALGVGEAVATAGNGHTQTDIMWDGDLLPGLPVRLRWFSDGLFIVRATKANADLLGAHVEYVGSSTPEDILARAARYISGTPANVRYHSPSILEAPVLLAAMGVTDTEGVTLRGRLQNGQQFARRLVALPVVPRDSTVESQDPWRALAPSAMSGDTGAWVSAIGSRDTVPVYLQDPDTLYRFVWLDGVVAYISVRATRNQPGRPPLPDFLSSVLADLRARRPRSIIVDLRDNPGGDYYLTRRFAKQLPSALPSGGHLDIITGNGTFSAAIVTTALLKYYAGTRGRIVGEQVGDRGHFWAEGGHAIRLPNSRIRVFYATAYHDWEHGCRDVRVCFWPNLFWGVAAGPLTPDTTTPLSFEDYAAGRDPALAAALGR